MRIELVWLAYDAGRVAKAWSGQSIDDLYLDLVKDGFRRRVNPATMLFHKGQFYLLDTLAELLKCGAGHLSLDQYRAYLFRKDVEEFPQIEDELFFDFRLISFFTSLRMADDYALAERMLTMALRHGKMLSADETFSVFSVSSIDQYRQAIAGLPLADLQDLAGEYGAEDLEFAGLARKFTDNYMDFFNYSTNNGFVPFLYNNYTNIRYWGDLVQRRHDRNARIVKLALQPSSGLPPLQPPCLIMGKRTVISAREKIMRHKTLDTLIAALLNESDLFVKQRAAESLGILGDDHAIPALGEALKEEVPEIRQEAALALGEIGHPSAIPFLLDALKDETMHVVVNAAMSLLALEAHDCAPSVLDTLKTGCHAVAPLLALCQPLRERRVFLNLLPTLQQSDNPLVREQGHYLAGSLGHQQELDFLAAQVNSAHEREQRVMLAAMSRLAERLTLKHLPKALEGELPSCVVARYKSKSSQRKKSRPRAL